jgi:hypothetical protein
MPTPVPTPAPSVTPVPSLTRADYQEACGTTLRTGGGGGAFGSKVYEPFCMPQYECAILDNRTTARYGECVDCSDPQWCVPK